MPEYRLTPDAEADLREIARYTLTTWGERQHRRYESALLSCLGALAAGEARPSSPLPHRDDVLALRCEHHVIYAVAEAEEPLTIVAVLHEQMDLMVRLRERLEGDET